VTWTVTLVSTAAQPTGAFETLHAWGCTDIHSTWEKARRDVINAFNISIRQALIGNWGYPRIKLREVWGNIRLGIDPWGRELTPDELLHLTALVDEARPKLPPVPLPPDTIQVSFVFPETGPHVYEGKTVAEIVSLIDNLPVFAVSDFRMRKCAMGVEIARVAAKGGLS
jgi:hypothetical protein